MFKQLGHGPTNCSVVEREATQRESTHVPWGDVDGTPCFALQYLRRHPSFLLCVSPSFSSGFVTPVCAKLLWWELSFPSLVLMYISNLFFFFFAVFCCVTSFFPHSELSKDPLPCEARVEWCWSSCSSCHQRNMTGLTNSPITRSKGESYDLPRNDADQNFTEVQYGSYYYFFSLSLGAGLQRLCLWLSLLCNELVPPATTYGSRWLIESLSHWCKITVNWTVKASALACCREWECACQSQKRKTRDVFTALHCPALNSGCKHRVRGHHPCLVCKTSKMASTSTLTNAFKHPVRRIAGDISVYWKLQASLLDVWSKKCHNCTVLSQSSGVVECRMTSNPW